MRDDPRGWYAEGLHAANRFVLRDRPMPPAARERLRLALDDPGWRSLPPQIPDGLPVREVVWLKVRVRGADGAPGYLTPADYAAIEEELGEQARSGLHRIDAREYVFVRRESGPEWLAMTGDVVGVSGDFAGFVALVAPQVVRVVNWLRGRNAPANADAPDQPPAGDAAGVGDVMIETHRADGARVVARYPADAAPATQEHLLKAFDRAAARLIDQDPSGA